VSKTWADGGADTNEGKDRWLNVMQGRGKGAVSRHGGGTIMARKGRERGVKKIREVREGNPQP